MKKITVAGTFVCFAILMFIVLLVITTITTKDAIAANPEQLTIIYRMSDSLRNYTIVKDVKTNNKFLVVGSPNGIAIAKMD